MLPVPLRRYDAALCFIFAMLDALMLLPSVSDAKRCYAIARGAAAARR